MREVTTQRPSFPDIAPNSLLAASDGQRWQVMCGDAEHWRCGFYSPEFGSADDVRELEWHDCPELFMLIEGRVSLLLRGDKGEYVLELEPLKPVLVTDWHCGFCPDGPLTGKTIVIERDAFRTRYKQRNEF